MEYNSRFRMGFIIKQTILLFIVASLAHFLYDITDHNFLIGLFSPINESIWEHLKLMFFPNLIWWLIIYVWKKEPWHLNGQAWLIASALCMMIAPLSVFLLYYGYTGAFGVHIVWLDISLVAVGYLLAFMVAFHCYPSIKPTWLKRFLAAAGIGLLLAAFVSFTMDAPSFPLFQSEQQ